MNPQSTVASVVLDHSECAAVFQRHRIDFCCKGGMSLESASAQAGVRLEELLGELKQAMDLRSESGGLDPRQLSTGELINHIVSKHHAYLQQTLPFVHFLAQKVGRVHGAHNPKLVELAQHVDQLVGSLTPHLEHEERTLFPALTASPVDGPLVARELSTMHADHLAVGALLEKIRAASEDFYLPEWACNSYRTLFAELERLESDVFRHVHLENHVLMPRFA